MYFQPLRTARVVDIEKYYSLTHPTTIGLLDNLESKMAERLNETEKAQLVYLLQKLIGSND